MPQQPLGAMSNFLEKLLGLTKYTVNNYKQNFLPRRLGLGYELRVKRVDRSIIKPILERSRKKVKIEEKEESEEVDKMSYIEKKRKK